MFELIGIAAVVYTALGLLSAACIVGFNIRGFREDLHEFCRTTHDRMVILCIVIFGWPLVWTIVYLLNKEDKEERNGY